MSDFVVSPIICKNWDNYRESFLLAVDCSGSTGCVVFVFPITCNKYSGLFFITQRRPLITGNMR